MIYRFRSYPRSHTLVLYVMRNKSFLNIDNEWDPCNPMRKLFVALIAPIQILGVVHPSDGQLPLLIHPLCNLAQNDRVLPWPFFVRVCVRVFGLMVLRVSVAVTPRRARGRKSIIDRVVRDQFKPAHDMRLGGVRVVPVGKALRIRVFRVMI